MSSPIDYPEDCRELIASEFKKIIEQQEWQEDIDRGYEALRRSGEEAELMRQKQLAEIRLDEGLISKISRGY
jgi:hypothetical protein